MSEPEKHYTGESFKSDKFQKPTIKDVAEAAGVSIATVSHVLNKTRFVSPETTVKVNNAIDSLKFKTNPIARNLRSGESRLIGFVVANMEHYFYVNIAKGIEKTINSQGGINWYLLIPPKKKKWR
jgi:LacI family transcriptional regulator